MTSELLGQTLGNRYRFDALLGKGVFAHVYRVTDQHRHATLAAKVLRRDIARDPDFLERFRREATVLAQLQHPHIVRYYDTVELEGYTFILMDYVPGRTLETALSDQDEPLRPHASLIYLTPLAAALEFAHSEGVVHRDLKPANILLHENSTLFITDFGIARILNTTSQLTVGMTVGTPFYMSPEQITGKPVTPATDIYALGIILYRMYTGLLPFRGESPGATGSSTATRVTYEHVNIPPVPPVRLHSDLDLAVQDVILCCLEKDPARRFASVGALYDALSEAIGAPPLSIEPEASAQGAEPSIEPPVVRPPEWSQFMAPLRAEAPAEDVHFETAPPQPAIEHPIPLPQTEPHLEKALKESEPTLVSHGSPDALPTLVSVGRVTHDEPRTLVHQQVESIPAPRVSPAPPARVVAPPHHYAARRPKRNWTMIAVVIGALLLATALCVAAIYLLQA
jgi:serine/threonine protein kinase